MQILLACAKNMTTLGEAVDRYGHLHVLCFTNKNEYWDIIMKEDMNYL